MNGGGMPPRPVDVQWQVASDEHFTKIVASGIGPGDARSSGIRCMSMRSGLQPATDYFYRFRVGNAISPVGRTRTAPAAGAALDQLRFAVANCQNYAAGYWPAYAAPAQKNPRSGPACGDYIYEYAPQPGDVRKHSPGVRSGARPLRDARGLPQPLRPVQERSGADGGARGLPLGAHLG